MIEDLKTDYKSDILMPAQQGKRTFNVVSQNGDILLENVHIEDNSQYLQVGDEYDNEVINEQNTAINSLARGTGLTFNTYQDYLDARALGEVPVGSIVYIKEGNQTVITANQVTYNDSNVKLTLDTVISRIAQINDDLSLDGMHTLSTGIRYGKIAGLVVVEINGISVAAPNTTIGTLPQGYRPQVGGTAKLGAGSYYADNVLVSVGTNGSIVVTGTYSAASGILGYVICV